MKRALVILSFALALPAFAQEAKSAAHLDGGWWKAKSSLWREAWVGGYKTGFHQGEGHDTNLSPFGTRELVDGLNKFYGDFRNRNISIHNALHFVADQLSGVPDAQLDAEVLKLRAAAVNGDVAE